MTCSRLQISKVNLVQLKMENPVVLSWFTYHFNSSKAKNFRYNFSLYFWLHISSHLLAHLIS
jgi:hypothetical protein